MIENIQRYFRYYLALLLSALLALGTRVQAAPLRPADRTVPGAGFGLGSPRLFTLGVAQLRAA